MADVLNQDRLAFLVEALDGRRFKMVIKGDLHKLQVEKIRRYLKSNGVPDGLDLTYNGKVLRDDMIGEDFGLVPNAVLKLVAAGGGGGGGSSQLHQQRGASPASKQQGGATANGYNYTYGASDSRSGSLGNTPNNKNWSTRYRSGSQQQQQAQHQRSNSGGGNNPTPFSSLRSGGGGSQDTFGGGAGGGLSSSPQSFQRLPSRATEIEDRFKELQAVHSDFTQNTTNTVSASASPFSQQQQQQQNPAGYYDPLAHERHLRMQRMTGGGGGGIGSGMGFVASSISPSDAPSGITYSSANVSMTSHQFPNSLGGSPAKQPPPSTSGNTHLNTQNGFLGGSHFAGLMSGVSLTGGGGGGVGAGVAGEGAGASSSAASASRLASLEAENERLRREVESLKLDLTRKRQEHPPSDDMLINAKANLLELSKDLGIHLAFDQNLTCVIGNEERNTILITFDAATERLYLYSTILTSLPSNEAVRLKLFELLLDGAMLGRDMAGGGVGISMQNNIAMMCTSFSLRNASQYALRDITPAFLEGLQRWRSAAGDLILSAT